MYDRVIDNEAARPLRSQTSMIAGLKKHDIVQWSSRLQRDFRTPMTRSARCCQPDWSRHGLTVDTRVLIVNDYYSRKLAPYTPGKDILVEAASPPGGLSYNCREFPGVPGSSPPRLVCNTTPPGFTPENCPELLQACNHISCGVAFPSHQIPVPTSPSPAKQTAFALKKKTKNQHFKPKTQKMVSLPNSKRQKTTHHPITTASTAPIPTAQMRTRRFR
jgi:hypothetical protein